MAFEVDHWFSPRFAVLAHEGVVGVNRKLLRAVDTTTRQPVLLMTGAVAPERAPRVSAGVPGLPRIVAWGMTPTWHQAFGNVPGVSLVDVLAQSRELGGDVPVEAATHIVATVARAVRELGARQEVDPVMSATVRLGFEGEVVHLGCNRAAGADEDDYSEVIRVIQVELIRRVTAPEPGLAPEEATPGAIADMRAEVFRLGALLQLLLDNEHPFEAEHPLHQLERLQLDRRRPLRRDVSAELRELVGRALAPNPADRHADPAELADALEVIVPPGDGPAAVKAMACGMFPRLREQQLLEQEQIATLDEEELLRDAPTAVMDGDAITRSLRPRVAGVYRSRLAFHADGRTLLVESHLVTNAEMVLFLDATGRPDPTSFVGRIPELADEPAVFVGADDAAAYAAFRGGRLPSEDDWVAMVISLALPDVTRVWEWTSTPSRTGFIVRGGPWRNSDAPGRVDNRSWEDAPASDVGFRVYFDRAGRAG